MLIHPRSGLIIAFSAGKVTTRREKRSQSISLIDSDASNLRGEESPKIKASTCDA
jgi:hypothetical protein